MVKDKVGFKINVGWHCGICFADLSLGLIKSEHTVMQPKFIKDWAQWFINNRLK